MFDIRRNTNRTIAHLLPGGYRVVIGPAAARTRNLDDRRKALFSTAAEGDEPAAWTVSDRRRRTIAFTTGTGAWTRYKVTAQIPADASLIRFGVFLNGAGQLDFRTAELAPHPPGQQ